MQNELITENIKSSGEPSPGGLNLGRVEDTIVQLVFGGILWNKVIFIVLLKRQNQVFCY